MAALSQGFAVGKGGRSNLGIYALNKQTVAYRPIAVAADTTFSANPNGQIFHFTADLDLTLTSASLLTSIGKGNSVVFDVYNTSGASCDLIINGGINSIADNAYARVVLSISAAGVLSGYKVVNNVLAALVVA